MSIIIDNLKDGAELPHSLALIEGRVESTRPRLQTFFVHNLSTGLMLNCPITNGQRFKVLVDLHFGWNRISLQCNDDDCGVLLEDVSLAYRPLSTRGEGFVRLLYVVCADDPEEGRFQGPPDRSPLLFSPESAMRRIATGAYLAQTFTAECLARHGLPRRTFRLKTDPNGYPVCERFTLASVTAEEARTKSALELWHAVDDALKADDWQHSFVRSVFVAFVSFTRYRNTSNTVPETHEEMMAHAKGHVSLGGGQLALLGTGCLHTWAEHVYQVPEKFRDCTAVDRLSLLDDSNYRSTYWACYATTLGAMCHEMGHVFGLGHSLWGMMSRGFTDTHLVFVPKEVYPVDSEELYEDRNETHHALSVSNPNGSVDYRAILEDVCPAQTFTVHIEGDRESSKRDYSEAPRWGHRDAASQKVKQHHVQRLHLEKDWGQAYWDRASAIWLSYHKWFNEMKVEDSGYGPQLHGLEIRCRHGLRIATLYSKDELLYHWEFLKGSGRLTHRLAGNELLKALLLHDLLADMLTVHAMDSFGNTLFTSIPKAALFE